LEPNAISEINTAKEQIPRNISFATWKCVPLTKSKRLPWLLNDRSTRSKRTIGKSLFGSQIALLVQLVARNFARESKKISARTLNSAEICHLGVGPTPVVWWNCYGCEIHNRSASRWWWEASVSMAFSLLFFAPPFASHFCYFCELKSSRLRKTRWLAGSSEPRTIRKYSSLTTTTWQPRKNAEMITKAARTGAQFVLVVNITPDTARKKYRADSANGLICGTRRTASGN